MKLKIKRMISILLVTALTAGVLPLSYNQISYAVAEISVLDLPSYPSNGQKYWVVFTEGFRNERLEMTTCDISGYGKYAYIVWNTSLLLRGANDTGKYNQYGINENGVWEQIGSYNKFTDYAVSVVASNLDIYDAYGNKIIAKTENYGKQNNTNFNDLTVISPQATVTPKVTATPRATAVPRTTATPRVTAAPEVPWAPYETVEPEITPEPYEIFEPENTLEPYETVEPETTLELYETAEPEIAPEPYETAEPEITPEPYETAEPEITPEPYETAESEITPKPYETVEPEITPKPYEVEESEITPDVSGSSGNTVEPESPTVSADSKEEEKKQSDEGNKLPKQGEIVTVGAAKYIVKKSAKSNGTVALYSIKQKNVSMAVVPEKIKINGYTFKVTGVYKNAFKNMKKLSDVRLGKNIKTIGNNAFQNCRKLKEVVIPKNVVSIGADAFSGSGLNYLCVKSKKLNMLGFGAFRNTRKRMVVLTPWAKKKQYMRMFVNQGRMSKKAVFY